MEDSRGGEFAAEGDFDILDDGSGREVEEVGEIGTGFEIHVVDHAGRLVVEMAVFFKIRTVARGFALEIHLADDAVLHEGFEAVVNRGQRDVRQAVFDSHEDVVRGRVVPLLHEGAVNFLALARHSQARDLIGDLDFGWDFRGGADHRGGNVDLRGPISRIILIMIFGLAIRSGPDGVAR